MINNALNLKDRVYQIFEHCDLPLHNNHDEQRIHSTTLVLNLLIGGLLDKFIIFVQEFMVVQMILIIYSLFPMQIII